MPIGAKNGMVRTHWIVKGAGCVRVMNALRCTKSHCIRNQRTWSYWRIIDGTSGRYRVEKERKSDVGDTVNTNENRTYVTLARQLKMTDVEKQLVSQTEGGGRRNDKRMKSTMDACIDIDKTQDHS